MTHTPKNTPPKSVASSPAVKPGRVLLTHPGKSREQAIVDHTMTNAYEANQSNLTRRAVYKTSDFDLSEDLVQSTFLKTLLYLQKGGQIDTMRAFLNHVLNDLIVDEYRKRKTVSLDVLLEQGFYPKIDYTEQLINILDGKQMIALIEQLPEKYKRVIKMRYVQGLTVKEIAALTEQSRNTVSVQSYRGLRKLAALETSTPA